MTEVAEDFDGEIEIATPRWCLPLLAPKRYKGAKGGRGSGKSHFFAEALVEEHVNDPTLQSVCIREIQKSLKHSAKKLIENKIRQLGVAHLFEIQQTEIKRKGYNATAEEGLIIFQGMQDHTADSIKSLEGFRIAWVEEAQSLSARSMELLLPTIRSSGSQIWFSWNPDQPDDPVEQLFASIDEEDGVVVHVNFMENPFCPEELKKEARRHLKYNPDSYGHVWLGEFNVKRDAIVFNGKWRVDNFEPEWDWEPLHGLDWGFANDPTAAVQCYVHNERLYIRRCVGRVGMELDDTPREIKEGIPEIEQFVIRADSARPESVSYCKRHGLPRIESVDKWPGSVEDGIEHMKSYKEIVVHEDCKPVQEELRHYAYKINKQSGEIMPKLADGWDHYIDAVRYALAPIIKNQSCDYSEIL